MKLKTHKNWEKVAWSISQWISREYKVLHKKRAQNVIQSASFEEYSGFGGENVGFLDENMKKKNSMISLFEHSITLFHYKVGLYAKKLQFYLIQAFIQC